MYSNFFTLHVYVFQLMLRIAFVSFSVDRIIYRNKKH